MVFKYVRIHVDKKQIVMNQAIILDGLDGRDSKLGKKHHNDTANNFWQINYL